MKTIYTLILLLANTISLQAQTPTWLWANRAGGVSSDEGSAITVDVLGNTYITGVFSAPSCSFGTTTLTNVSFTDVFIAKYDASSNLVWAKSAGGLGYDKSTSIAVDTSGNVYVTGYFNSSTITFDTITLTTTAGYDMFIAKYNSNGNILWAKNIGGASADYSNSISVDSIGNSFITGYFRSASIQFGSTTLFNTATGGSNYFVAKYNSLGSPVWAKAAVSGNVTGNSIKSGNNGSLFVTGFFSGTATFDTITKTSIGSKDIFTAKYDALGNVAWVKSIGGLNEEISYGISTDGYNNSYVTGYFKSIYVTVGTTTFTNSGAPDGDVLTVKYNNAGNVVWAKKVDNYSNALGLAIATDVIGNSYVTGNYLGSPLTFGSIVLNGPSAMTNVGDLFVVKYDPSGTPLWARNLLSTIGARGSGIAIDNVGNCYLTGFFDDATLAFDNTTLANVGNLGEMEIFVGKLGPSSTVGIHQVDILNELTLFPNPSSGILFINLNNNSFAEIAITNILGELIYKTTTKTQQTEIDLRTEPIGIYLIKMTDENKNVTSKKIIKQ
ncbi:MAG: SBBP repeat-containing protein [Bacteroidota bacterium]